MFIDTREGPQVRENLREKEMRKLKVCDIPYRAGAEIRSTV